MSDHQRKQIAEVLPIATNQIPAFILAEQVSERKLESDWLLWATAFPTLCTGFVH